MKRYIIVIEHTKGKASLYRSLAQLKRDFPDIKEMPLKRALKSDLLYVQDQVSVYGADLKPDGWNKNGNINNLK